MFNSQPKSIAQKYFAKSQISMALFSILFIASTSASNAKSIPTGFSSKQVSSFLILGNQQQQKPKIQLAILLDTSSSMDGLINQTRNQIWQVVNEFTTAKQNGVKPILEVALFEYGNDSNSPNSGFVRQLTGFTRELDKVSEGLFSLTTNGGSEYCGYAIKTAVNTLQWSAKESDIKTIFIAGNEPFTQGPINYRDALMLAKQKGIAVNTIHAGNHQTGIQTGWQSGALLAGGDYMSIDANRKVVHLNAPQDLEIAQLNQKLNQTYLPFGDNGKANKQRQQQQDKFSSNISPGLMAKRAKSKASSFYSNASWDLVDALEEGEIDSDALAKMKPKDLPEPMQTMNDEQKKQYILGKSEQRKTIRKEIAELSRSRAIYVAEETKKLTKSPLAAAPSISDALTKSIKKQAKEKHFTFEK